MCWQGCKIQELSKCDSSSVTPWFSVKDSETELCVQRLWVVYLRTTPVRKEKSGIKKREKLNCYTCATETSTNTMGSSGARMIQDFVSLYGQVIRCRSSLERGHNPGWGGSFQSRIISGERLSCELLKWNTSNSRRN